MQIQNTVKYCSIGIKIQYLYRIIEQQYLSNNKYEIYKN